MDTKLAFGALALLLSACATNQIEVSTQLINGKFYLMGENCARFQVLNSESIKCMDAKGQLTHVATGLTAEQAQQAVNSIEGYNAVERARQAQEIAALTATLQRTAQTFQQSAQSAQKLQGYTPPIVVNPNATDTTKIFCLKAGIYVHCRTK